jgi:GntR family transcriptional regulator
VEKIEVRLASGDEATYLDVPPGSALLLIIRTTSDPGGDPIEYSRDLFRGDRTRVIVRSGTAARTGDGRAEVVALRPELAPVLTKVDQGEQDGGDSL